MEFSIDIILEEGASVTDKYDAITKEVRMRLSGVSVRMIDIVRETIVLPADGHPHIINVEVIVDY